MIEKGSSPKFDEYGMTQWFWRVTNIENFKLGKHVEIGSFTIIDAKNSVSIEDNVKIGWNCTIMSNSTIDERKGKVTLKEGCKIGANSVIFPNITIGKNSVVGANSLVNHDIPDNEMWIGTPAKKHR
jgi:acetyltransferase-like isoleucine patch superfamily enzyme